MTIHLNWKKILGYGVAYAAGLFAATLLGDHNTLPVTAAMLIASVICSLVETFVTDNDK